MSSSPTVRAKLRAAELWPQLSSEPADDAVSLSLGIAAHPEQTLLEGAGPSMLLVWVENPVSGPTSALPDEGTALF